jgi:hypothetical protein
MLEQRRLLSGNQAGDAHVPPAAYVADDANQAGRVDRGDLVGVLGAGTYNTGLLRTGNHDTPNPGTSATYSLVFLGIDGETASLELWLDYQATNGEQMVYAGIDVSSSSPELTGGGSPDYTAFSFTQASPLLDDWQVISEAEFGSGEQNGVVELETGIAPLGGGTYRLGVLQVDLAAAGVPPGELPDVSVGGRHSVLGVERPDDSATFRFLDVAFSTPTNTDPTVDAGDDLTIEEGQLVTLRGTYSDADPNDDRHSLRWEVSSDNGQALAPGQQSLFQFTANDDGRYAVTFTVTDARSGTSSDTILVTVVNVAPVVDAGPDLSGSEGQSISLHGSVVDAGLADIATVRWQVSSADGRTVFHGTGEDMSFVPVDDGIYNATLHARDDDGAVSTDTALITVANQAPMANAGPDLETSEGQQIVLDGSYTDPGTLDRHSFRWQVTSDTGLIVAEGMEEDLRFAPVDDGIYTASYRVTDDSGASDTDTAIIRVTNEPPRAQAGPDRRVLEGQALTLVGRATDPGQDDRHSHLWHVESDNGQVIADSNGTELTFTPDDNGIYTVTYQVSDETGASDTDTVIVRVENAPPRVDAGPATVDVNEGETVSLSSVVTDAGLDDTHTLRWHVATDNGQIVADGTQTDFFFVPANEGTYTVTLRVTDDDGAAASDTTVVRVANVAPTADAGPAEMIADEGQELVLTSTIDDPGAADHHQLQWRVTRDAAETVAEDTGEVLRFTPAGEGTYTVTLEATDDQGASGTDTVTLTVRNVAPQVEAGPDRSAREGDEIELTAQVRDPGQSDTHTYRWSVVADDGQSIAEATDPTFRFVVPDNGTYTATLEVWDDHGDAGSDTVSIVVDNLAPSVDIGGNQIAREGDQLTFGGLLSDPGANDTHSWRWQVVSAEDGMIAEGGSPQFSFQPPDNGLYAVSLQVTDNAGGMAVDQAAVLVTNAAPTVDAGPDRVVDEGDEVLLDGAVVSDAGIDDTHRFLWQVSASNGQLIGSVRDPQLRFVPRDDGLYTVTLQVTDDDGGVATDQVLVEVANAAPAADPGPSQTVSEGQLVRLRGTVSDPGQADTHRFAWQVTSPEGQLVAESTRPQLSFVPRDNGPYQASFQVTDDDGASHTETVALDVSNVAPVADAGPAQPAVEEGRAVALRGSLTDVGTADTHTFRWQVTSPDGQVLAETTLLDFGFLPPDNGIYTATFQVTDDDGAADTDSRTITAANVPPTVVATTDRTVAQGEQLQLQLATFTDPGFTNLLAGTSETFTATIDWGDGTVGDGQVHVTQGSAGVPTTGTVSGSHLYQSAGNYTVTVTVADDDGGEGADAFPITVQGVNLVLAQLDNKGSLTLHLGPRAGDRGEDQTDGDETFLLAHVAGVAGDETVSVTYQGQTQTFEGVARITADGGQGHDTIQLGPDVLSSAILSGGPGDDTLTGGSGNDVLVGDAGSNHLRGGLGDDKYGLAPAAHDVIIDVPVDGGPGNAGFDTLHFCGATSGITIDLDQTAPVDQNGLPDVVAGAQTVDANGHLVTLVGQIENFVGSPFGDHVTLKPLPDTQRVVQGGDHQPGSVGDQLQLNSTQLPAGVAVVDTGLSLEAEGYGPVRYSQIETGVAIPNAVLFQGVSPPLADSTATLVLPADPAAGRQFRWISDDSGLGSIDTGLTSATVWNVVGSNPQRLILRAAAQGITLQANVTFAPTNQALVDVVKAGEGRVRYLLQLDESTTEACDELLLPQPSNAAPLPDPLGNLVVEAGQSVSLVATFSDPGDPGQHRATVQWGDGSTSSGVIDFQDGSGTVTAEHVYGDGGTYTVTVQVIDQRGATGTSTALITVELPRGAKLLVVDQSAHQMFRYDGQVELLGQSALASAAPRGAATDPLGQTLWVIGANNRATVDVFAADGTTRGSWQARDVNQGVGIASDGAHVWIVTDAKDQVHFYQDAAQHLSGQHSADSAFDLDKQNKNPSGLTTSGTTLWVTDEKKNDPRVFVYDVQGTALGQWSLDPRNNDPSGIALDASGGDLWVVDRHDAAVYLYRDSIDQRQGSLAADLVLPLDAANHNPEGIADFPTVESLAAGSDDPPDRPARPPLSDLADQVFADMEG